MGRSWPWRAGLGERRSMSAPPAGSRPPEGRLRRRRSQGDAAGSRPRMRAEHWPLARWMLLAPATGVASVPGWGSRSGGRGTDRTEGRAVYTTFPYQGVRGMDDSSHKSKDDFFFFKDRYRTVLRHWADLAADAATRQQGDSYRSHAPRWERGDGVRATSIGAGRRETAPARPRREGRAGTWRGTQGATPSAWRAMWRLREGGSEQPSSRTGTEHD